MGGSGSREWKQNAKPYCKLQDHTALKPGSPELHHQRNVCLVAGIYNIQGPFAEVIHRVEAH